MHLGHSLCIQHIQDRIGCLFQISIRLSRLYLPHKDNVFLIHSRDKVLGLCRKQASYGLQGVGILLIFRFNEEHHALYVCLDMELFGPVVNIHQEQVIQQKVFNKVVLIKPLFIGHQQILDLERRQLSHHVNIVAASLCKEDVFQLVLVKYLKKLIAGNHLTVCRRICKGKDGVLILFCLLKRGCQNFSFHVADAEIDPGNFFQSVNVRLQDLI